MIMILTIVFLLIQKIKEQRYRTKKLEILIDRDSQNTFSFYSNYSHIIFFTDINKLDVVDINRFLDERCIYLYA